MLKILSFILVSVFAFSALGKTMLNTEKSMVKWKGTKLYKADSHAGTIKIKEGHVTFDGEMVTGGEVTIDMNTIETTDDMKPKDKKNLVGHLKSEDFFAVGTNGTSTFKITSVKKMGDKFQVEGELMIRGKKQKMKFPMTMKREGEEMMAMGTFKFDRAKFDVKYNSKSFFPNLVKKGKDKVIDDMVEVQLALYAPMPKMKTKKK